MIRGTKRALEKRPSVKANINASIHNRFDIEVVDAKTGEVKQKAQAENVVCDYLWTQMLKKSGSDSTKWFQTIIVGDGTGTPSASDTTLFHYLASYTPAEADDVYRFDKKGHVASITRKVTILETQLVGNELTEVGISNATSSTCTHAMLTDMNGNPVSILKTDSDIINIYATAFVHWTADNDEWLVFADESTLIRYALGQSSPAAPSPYANFYGDPENSPTVSGNMSNNTTTDVTNRKFKITFPRLAAANGNGKNGGFDRIGVGPNSNQYLMLVHPDWYTPPPVVGEALGVGDGVTTAFATKFRDISDATVYVNGVAAAATIKPVFPFVHIESALYALNRVDESGLLVAIPPNGAIAKNGTIIFENPHTDVFGISKMTSPDWENGAAYTKVSMYMSDDLVNWDTVVENVSADVAVPEALQRKKYIKFVGGPSGNYSQDVAVVTDVDSAHNVIFDVPPAEGAVITIDYTPGTIAKDENHVFDFSIEFTFGEYNPDA